jgi:ribosomal protein L16 Arg81 hydroxylase
LIVLGGDWIVMAAAVVASVEPLAAGYPSSVDAGSKSTRPKRPSGAEISRAFQEVLLTPEFWEKHWERYPLHHRASDGGPRANLLPDALLASDIANLLSRAGPSIKVFKKGETVDEENFRVAYLDGASLIVNQADRYDSKIYTFCRALAERYFHHVFAVVYLTPPKSWAVRLHNDDQDVFLLQVWGKKHWIIRDAPKLCVYSEEMLGKDDPVPPELISEPIMSFDLLPGDILYIPRGFLHEATTTTEPSLHITVTMPTSDYCWGVQLVKHLMQEVHSNDVPPVVQKACHTRLVGPDCPQDDSVIDEQLQEILKNWSSKISVDGVIGSFERRMARVNDGQERAHGQAMTMSNQNGSITEDCRIRLMFGVSCWCEPNSELAVFKRDTQRLELPISKGHADLIRSLTSRPQKVADLPCADPFERYCVLELLHQHGIVQVFLRDADESTIS